MAAPTAARSAEFSSLPRRSGLPKTSARICRQSGLAKPFPETIQSSTVAPVSSIAATICRKEKATPRAKRGQKWGGEGRRVNPKNLPVVSESIWEEGYQPEKGKKIGPRNLVRF